eukprot:TRINITY_DN10999_c0_g1_i1.p1 TRINITY_DN10999_c0_g1~~TRINITY_DN10999_c0_g1_i1.p1  ORF type:complete len:199 (+),score=70.42 TRINITY_DN10999_c0_g1_i1:114-710(+)
MGLCVSAQHEEEYDKFELPQSLLPGQQQHSKQKQKQQQKLLDILKHPQLSPLFKEYLRSVLCVEAYCFFMEVEEYKDLEDTPSRIATAQRIFDKYFQPDSEYEIHVEGTLVAMLKESLGRPAKDTFDLIQQLILITLQGSCLPNFLTWDLYESFISDPMTRKTFMRRINRTPSFNQIVKYSEKMKKLEMEGNAEAASS